MKIVSVNLQIAVPEKVTVPMLEEEFEEFIKSKKWETEAMSVTEDDEIVELLRREQEEEDNNDEFTQNSYY